MDVGPLARIEHQLVFGGTFVGSVVVDVLGRFCCVGTHWQGFVSGYAGGDGERARGTGEVRCRPASSACTVLFSLFVFNRRQIQRRLATLRSRERACLVVSDNVVSCVWVAGTRYRAIGRLMVKCLLEGRRIGSRLAPSVFKFITGTDTTLRDLQVSEEGGGGRSGCIPGCPT